MLKHSIEYSAGLDVPLENRRRLAEKTGRPAQHTPPSMDHYPHAYKHDLDYSAMAYARHNAPRLAVEDIYAIFHGMDPVTGFIPNMRFDSIRFYDPEPLTFMHPRSHSDYSQPPLEAKAVAETFDACVRLGKEDDGQLFLEDIYPKLKKSYEYFINYRQNSPGDPLIGVIHPHETGRDSDPTFDFIKWRPTRNGSETAPWKDLVGSAMDYMGAYAQNVKNRTKGWDARKIREQFWVNDVMFNCMYADNLGTLANIAGHLGNAEDAARFKFLSAEVFNQVSNKMWDPLARGGDGAFYALNKDGSKIPEISISNLFPLLNPNLPENQVFSLVKLINKSFDTNYQLPTVATDSPNYDPEYQGKGIMWRGPVWLWMNDGIAEGLERQAYRTDIPQHLAMQCGAIASDIRYDSEDLCLDGRETHSPNTGEGQRVHNFSGNAIGHVAIQSSLFVV